MLRDNKMPQTKREKRMGALERWEKDLKSRLIHLEECPPISGQYHTDAKNSVNFAEDQISILKKKLGITHDTVYFPTDADLGITGN